MKAKTGQIALAMTATALAGTLVLAQAQVTGGQAKAAQAQATKAAQARPASGTAAAPAASASAASPASAGSAAPKVAAPRRDPFRPLIQEKKPDALPTRLPAGKPGLVIGQLVIQGIVRNVDGKWVAVVDNKTKRSYFLYERDELFNGVVTKITADSVTFEERSLDAAGRTQTREVVKRIGG